METESIVRVLGNWSTRRGPLHHRLTSALEDAMKQGLLPSGTRVPAERNLAEALAISRTTVVAAYNTLRTDGWFESRLGSGTWVCAQRARIAFERTQAEALSRSSLMNLLLADGEAIDLALGVPMPLAEFAQQMFSVPPDVATRFHSERSLMPLGLPALREAIAHHYARQGFATTADHIIVTSGAQQGISLITSLFVQRGDTVLVENPAYFGALEAFRLAGARLADLPIGRQHVDPQLFRDRIAANGPRLTYLTATYQNPTGATMPDTARQAIAEFVDAFGSPLIEDNTLGDLTLDRQPPRLIASYSKSSNVLTVGSLSKLFWSGLRIGWVRAAPPLIQQLGRIKSTCDLGAPLITQAIETELLQHTDRAKTARKVQLTERRKLAIDLLREHLPEWEFSVPSGGLFLWVKLPEADSRQFAQYAARCHVSLTPGTLFSVTETHSEFLRVPFLLEEDTLAAGILRLAEAWREFRGLTSARVAQTTALV